MKILIDVDDGTGQALMRAAGTGTDVWIQWDPYDETACDHVDIVEMDGEPFNPPECLRKHRTHTNCRKRH